MDDQTAKARRLGDAAHRFGRLLICRLNRRDQRRDQRRDHADADRQRRQVPAQLDLPQVGGGVDVADGRLHWFQAEPGEPQADGDAERRANGAEHERLAGEKPPDLVARRAQRQQDADLMPALGHADGEGVVDQEHADDEGRHAADGEPCLHPVHRALQRLILLRDRAHVGPARQLRLDCFLGGLRIGADLQGHIDPANLPLRQSQHRARIVQIENDDLPSQGRPVPLLLRLHHCHAHQRMLLEVLRGGKTRKSRIAADFSFAIASSSSLPTIAGM